MPRSKSSKHRVTTGKRAKGLEKLLDAKAVTLRRGVPTLLLENTVRRGCAASAIAAETPINRPGYGRRPGAAAGDDQNRATPPRSAAPKRLAQPRSGRRSLKNPEDKPCWKRCSTNCGELPTLEKWAGLFASSPDACPRLRVRLRKIWKPRTPQNLFENWRARFGRILDGPATEAPAAS